jgi:hypothetical protein
MMAVGARASPPAVTLPAVRSRWSDRSRTTLAAAVSDRLERGEYQAARELAARD